MVHSVEAYIERLEEFDDEELLEEEERLEDYIYQYENQLLPRFLYCSFPSPKIVYEMNNAYLAEVKKEIERRKSKHDG